MGSRLWLSQLVKASQLRWAPGLTESVYKNFCRRSSSRFFATENGTDQSGGDASSEETMHLKNDESRAAQMGSSESVESTQPESLFKPEVAAEEKDSPRPGATKFKLNLSGLEESLGKKDSQFKLNLDGLGGPKRSSPNGADKFKLDLTKLFPAKDANEPAASEPAKPFKLNLSRLKNLVADAASSTDKLSQDEKSSRNPMRRGNAGPAASGAREVSLHKLDVLNKLGNMGNKFIALAPKEDLLKKFFSPENMSAAERHKLELQEIREAFKIHDSDCGSSPVQIALLTQKIKYVAAHLTHHKKDKHTRKGLQGMIDKRRRLLIYLRRKDWDSYCYLITKLGLRDKLDANHT